jgi:ABC-type multidrug transport system ATPase subunit
MTLEFDGIEFGFDERRLLTGVHMRVDVGQVVGLLGRNGTGKSTIMKIVFGAIRPDVASVRIDGKAVSQPALTSGLISYLPQDSFVPVNLTLRKILSLYHLDSENMLQFFPELVEDLALRPSHVSGGRMRLFEVLLILMRPAPFCMLDEPFTGLSPLFVDRLQELIILKKRTKGIIISDHLYRKVMAIADSAYLLSNGTTFLVKEPGDLVKRGFVYESADEKHSHGSPTSSGSLNTFTSAAPLPSPTP